jgi:hypothetical protein
MFQFILGALAGGFAAWYWRQDIEGYVNDKVPSLRVKAADGLEAIEKRTGDMMDKAKTGVVTKLRAGGDALRRGPEPGDRAQSGTGTSGMSGTSGTSPQGGLGSHGGRPQI